MAPVWVNAPCFISLFVALLPIMKRRAPFHITSSGLSDPDTWVSSSVSSMGGLNDCEEHPSPRCMFRVPAQGIVSFLARDIGGQASSEWAEGITHLIVGVDEDGVARCTFKVGGLSSHVISLLSRVGVVGSGLRLLTDCLGPCSSWPRV